MDSWLIARYQSLINLFQHKPIWWIEQCAYILAIGAAGRFFFRPETTAWTYFMLFFDVLLVVFAWRAGRSEPFKEHAFGRQNTFVRCFFLAFVSFQVAMDVLIMVMGLGLKPFNLFSDMSQIALMSCFYFGSCEPPPPPKPRTKMAFEGNNS